VRIGRFFGKLDDWVNPIVVKELRQAVRSRLVVAALMLFLLLQLLIVGVYLLNSEASGRRDAHVFSAGRELFQVIQGILLGTCLLVPVYAGCRLGVERSDTNVDLLFISTLRPRAIVSGKLFSAVVLVLLVYSACTPFMTFTYLLRGLDIPTILLILAIDFLVVLWSIQATLFLAAIPAPAAVRGLFLLLALGGLLGTFTSTQSMTHSLMRYGVGPALDSWEFWAGALAMAVTVLAMVGTVFVWSVAVLSPPSANRSLPVRLYLVFFWLITWTAATVWSRQAKHLEPLAAWVLVNGLLFATMLVVGISEREQWGARVARTIPRRWWLRGPAFLLYSGAAGGLAFAVLMLGLTIGLGLVAADSLGNIALATALIGGYRLAANIKLTLLLVLYVYCYGLSGVLVRRMVFGRHLKPNGTWLVVVLLLGLGCVLPYMAAYFFDPEALHYSRREPLWQMTNPFAAIDEATSSRHRIREYYDPETGTLRYDRATEDILDAPCLPFLTIWAVVMTALAAPWFALQAAAFRPPGGMGAIGRPLKEEKEEKEEEAVEVTPITEEPGGAP
jgi:hypothetical protein